MPSWADSIIFINSVNYWTKSHLILDADDILGMNLCNRVGIMDVTMY